MNIFLHPEEEDLLKEIIDILIINLQKEKISFENVEKYIFDNFFDPTKREKTIFEKGQTVPKFDQFEKKIVDRMEHKGVVIRADDKILPTPLGVRLLRYRSSDEDLQSLLLMYQNRLGKKYISTFSKSIKYLNLGELASIIFLLYNNNTAEDRSYFPDDEDVAKTIDKIIQSFVEGKESKGTRSLNGRPGGGYFVSANRKLGFPLHMKHPHYYIKSTEIYKIKYEIRNNIHHLILHSKKKFNLISSLESFEQVFNDSIGLLMNKKVLFSTDESKKDIRDLIRRGIKGDIIRK